ncbi:unnamed protein product, partial [Hymenolepis diminuta]|uniref:PAM2 domain-containing protein n=2 Tax=Hymenolepis diminuta TaxID=6216 RepID=A0A0R3SX06_HYMDI
VSAQSPTPPIPKIPSDSDYRQLQFPQSESIIVPATSHAYQWLNVADSDLRQSSIVPVNTLVSPPPVAVTNTVTSNQTLSPFNASLPPPPSQLSTPVRPQVASILPPFQTTPSLPSSAQITAMSHPPIPLQTYQPQQQQNPLSSQIPNIPETLLSTLQRTSSSQPSQQPAYQPTSSNLPVTTQSQYTFANQVVNAVASNNVGDNNETPKSQEDPFSIIFRITGLSDLIKSAKSGKSMTGGNSPATPVTPKADTISTPTYPEGVKEVEKNVTVEKPVTQVSGSSSSSTAHQHAMTTQDAEVDGGQSDGGATPTQDESENPNDAPPVTNCFAFSQTGQMNFPPPPIQTTSTASNNLLINILPMSLPPTFNSMSQPPWHTGLPPGLGGGRPPPPQTFFPVFPPSMLSRPPNFSNLPNSQSNQ